MSVTLNPALLPPGAAPAAQQTGGARPTPQDTALAGPSFADVLEQVSAPAGPRGPRVSDVAAPAHAAHPPTPTGSGTTATTGATGAQQLRFSKHAVQRAQRRGIPLDPTTLGRLQEGVGRIAGKGSRDSLVLVDGNAFVVSVPNRTVITAVAAEHMREHVFTNIDSAVIA